MSEEQPLSRRTRSQRNQSKESAPKDTTNKILNLLIVVVSVLIVISLVLILSNDELKSDIKQSTTNNESQHEPANGGNQGTAEEETNEESTEESGSITETTAEALPGAITMIESTDENVIQAWTNDAWQPYQTAQTGPHTSAFDKDALDYQEKIALLYQDTGFTEDTSIIWSVKNQSGNTVAVFSTIDQKEMYRLTMQWVENEGWQTILIEQLQSLEGAY